MSVKMLLMWNSKMLIDGGGDSIVATSLLDASNLIVLKVHCLLQIDRFSILLFCLICIFFWSYILGIICDTF